METFTLYQFPISHYCEKVRWALDHKQVDYRIVNLLPGFHIFSTRRLAAQTSVPILRHGAQVIQGSSAIISYLDETVPRYPLTPEESSLKAEALAWEEYIDEGIGTHVRRICYATLLDYPELVIPLYTEHGPWYGKYLLPPLFPLLRHKMRRMMDINPPATQHSQQQLSAALDKLRDHLGEHRFLVGNRFSRADLALAALLAPLFKPARYGINWPASYPEPLQLLCDSYAEKIGWVRELYEEYR